MADYKLTAEGVVRAADGAHIPNDPRNRDWRAYHEWLAKGNTPDPADVIVPRAPPLTAEVLFVMLKAKGMIGDGDRPKP